MPRRRVLLYLRDNPIHTLFQFCSSPGSSFRAAAAATRCETKSPDRNTTRRLADELLIELATSTAGHGDWSVCHSPGAAPELLRNSEPSAFTASVTHSDDWIAAGLAFEANIGVDIQIHKDMQRASEIGNYLNLVHTECGESPFFDAWVLREAITKATRGSLLDAHPVEAELAAACRRHGYTVRAAGFEAIVQLVAPQVSFAVVVHHDQAMRHCA